MGNSVPFYLLLSMPLKDKFPEMVSPRCNLVHGVFRKVVDSVLFKNRRPQPPLNLILMQFGTRRLSEGSGLRALQEQEAAAPSEFDLAVQLEAADDGPAALQTAAGASVGTMLCTILASLVVF